MKCVRLLQTGEVYRVEDLMARVVVEIGQAVYVPKQIWKSSGRKYTKNLNSNNQTGKVEVG